MKLTLFSLFSENKLYGYSIEEYLDYVSSYGKTFIFFDTETTGLTPQNNQLTEISAIACDPSDFEFSELDSFSLKIKLGDDIKKRLQPGTPEYDDWMKQYSNKKIKEPADILRLTRYGEKNREYYTEQEAFDKFFSWVESFPEPILIAQNARFDMSFLSRSGIKNTYKVIDTLKAISLFFFPALQAKAAAGDQEAKDIYLNILHKNKPKDQWGPPKKHTTPIFASSSLGVIAPALGVSSTEWHNALADVKMMIGVFRKILLMLKNLPNTNYSSSVLKKRSEERIINDRKKRKKK